MWKTIDFSKDKLPEMVKMTLENYGEEESISHLDFVNHEYFENPSGNALVKLAYDNEKEVLAGQYIINPHSFLINGNNVNALLSLNTLTRKEYRGQKIFTVLAEKGFDEAKEKGFSFCYGAPNPNSYPGFINKLGFSKLCEMPLYVRPLKFSKIVKEKTNAFLEILTWPFNIFSIIRKTNDTNIVELSLDNYRIIDNFWNSILNKYDIIGIRNAEYVKYRYLNVPRREYYPYVYLIDDKPIAFAVARIRKVSNITTGMIADFLYVSGYEKQAIKLIKFLLATIKSHGANLAGCIMMRHSGETKILKKAGFIKCPNSFLPQPTPLIIRVFDDSLIGCGIMDPKKWFFTTGDYDVV